jgi:hypothetical protein
MCTFSADGNSGSADWRPDSGKESPDKIAYDVTTTRVN